VLRFAAVREPAPEIARDDCVGHLHSLNCGPPASNEGDSEYMRGHWRSASVRGEISSVPCLHPRLLEMIALDISIRSMIGHLKGMRTANPSGEQLVLKRKSRLPPRLLNIMALNISIRSMVGHLRWVGQPSRYGEDNPPRQLCHRNSSLCSFLGKFYDLPMNVDRILTESVNKLTES
jgi:hypothetical protein